MCDKFLGLFRKRVLSAEERMDRFREYLGSLEDRQIFLQKKVAAEYQKAKAFANVRNEKEALQCLKRMALYEGQLDKVRKIHFRVIEQMAADEYRMTVKEAVDLLKYNVDATKTMHKKPNKEVDDRFDSAGFDSARFDEDVLKAKLIKLKAEVDVQPFYMP